MTSLRTRLADAAWKPVHVVAVILLLIGLALQDLVYGRAEAPE